MGKTILVLTGSPRAGGNSDQLAEAFIRGAQGAGNQVLRFDAGRKNIGSCVGCGRCFSGPTPCVSPDDFTELSGYLQQADAIAIFTPLYWYTYPAKLKAAIDKFFSYYASGQRTRVKESIFIVCGEDKDIKGYDLIVGAYEKMAELMHWEDKGHIVVPGVGAPGEVQQTPAIEGMVKIGTYY